MEAVEFSIIIPVQKINDYIEETCGKLKNQTFKNFETIIFPDELPPDHLELETKLKAKIIATGAVSPARKRDLALKHAKGKILAFTDDDAFPEKDWLKIAKEHLKAPEVAAIGGPQLTPPDDSFWQKVSGAMFISPLSGSAIIRYWPGKLVREVDDWPTVNFFIKKEDFLQIGGFDNHFWPGEDTKLCLDVIKKLKKKILYIPNLKVYHHRRSGLSKHLKQTGGYGLHRGHFAKILPETSFKLIYFIPSLFVLFVLGGIVGSFFSEMIRLVFLMGMIIYLTAVFISTMMIWNKTRSLMISLATIPYLISFHFWYGVRFIQGFVFTKELNSKLGK